MLGVVEGGVAMTCAELGLSEEGLRKHQPHSLVLMSLTSWRLIGGARAARKGRSTPSNRLRGPTPDFLSGFTPLAFSHLKPTARQHETRDGGVVCVPYKHNVLATATVDQVAY